MKTYQVRYSVGDSFKDIHYLYYDGPNDPDLISSSAVLEIKKHLKGSISGKIRIIQIVEYKAP